MGVFNEVFESHMRCNDVLKDSFCDGTFENKKRSELLFKKSQKIAEQSNEPFLKRLRPKKWRSDLTPRPE